MGCARPARMAAEILARGLDRLVHLGVGLVEDVVDHDVSCAGRGARARRDAQRPDLLTLHGAKDRTLVGHPEDDHRQLVLAAQRERGLVHDLQPARDGLVVGQLVELGRLGVLLGVRGVDPVDPRLVVEHHVALALQRPLDSHGVGGEERHPHPGPEDHHAPLLHVADRAAWHVGLGDLADRDRGLHAASRCPCTPGSPAGPGSSSRCRACPCSRRTRSMPRCCSSAPRKKLPPPVTTAICTPASTTLAISRAIFCTTSGSTPTLPPPKTSPESLSSTRSYPVTGGAS